jgi:hypothetical protein
MAQSISKMALCPQKWTCFTNRTCMVIPLKYTMWHGNRHFLWQFISDPNNEANFSSYGKFCVSSFSMKFSSPCLFIIFFRHGRIISSKNDHPCPNCQKNCTNWGEKHTRWPCEIKVKKWHKELPLLHDIERLTICHSVAIFFKKKLLSDTEWIVNRHWSERVDLQVHDSRQPGPSVRACVESNDDRVMDSMYCCDR